MDWYPRLFPWLSIALLQTYILDIEGIILSARQYYPYFALTIKKEPGRFS
jgi:hypothetical protein